MNIVTIIENYKYVIIFNIICIISYIVSYNYKKQAIPDKVHIRPFNDHCKTIILFIVFNTVLYFFGNINLVLDNCKLNTILLSLILICGASIFFSSLSFNKEFQTDLTRYNKWSGNVKLLFFTFIFITITCFSYLIKENSTSEYNDFYNKNKVKKLILIALSYYIITFVIYKLNKDKYVYHPHHWTIFYIMAFFPNNIIESDLAYIMSMIFIGFYIQGVGVYNYSSILQD
tara:strand:- start:285 stop:974 length:690 start_codon:yes stop_codon:yes gene_type:complete